MQIKLCRQKLPWLFDKLLAESYARFVTIMKIENRDLSNIKIY